MTTSHIQTFIFDHLLVPWLTGEKVGKVDLEKFDSQERKELFRSNKIKVLLIIFKRLSLGKMKKHSEQEL